jgi:hypothetical protein
LISSSSKTPFFERQLLKPPGLLPLVLVSVGFALLYSTTKADNTLTLVFVGILGLALIASSIWLFAHKTRLKLSKTHLILTYTLFNFGFKTKEFEIYQIENLKLKQNVKSDSYTSKGHVKVMGIDKTPESWKTYYYHKELLQFEYKNKYITIGEYAERFDAPVFFELISELQKGYNTKGD